MRISAIAVTLLAAASLPAAAQTIATPKSTDGAAATVLHSAGSAVGAVPAAHEIPANTVVPTVPAAQPFAAGVTGAGTSVSNGLTKTGDNVRKDGIRAYPTNSLSSEHQTYQVRAAQRTVDQAKSAVPGADELKCDAQELANGEC